VAPAQGQRTVAVQCELPVRLVQRLGRRVHPGRSQGIPPRWPGRVGRVHRLSTRARCSWRGWHT
jgi:hypothetical protein